MLRDKKKHSRINFSNYPINEISFGPARKSFKKILLQSIFGKWIKILQKEITSYKSRETNCSFLLSNKYIIGIW